MPDSTIDFFRLLARVLLRCWILGFLLLFVWLAAIMEMGDPIYQMHHQLFGLSRHEVYVIHYCGLGLYKLFVMGCFFLPWVAVKLTLKSSRS